MRTTNIVTLALIIIGGFNWGMVSWFGEDMVSLLLGRSSTAARLAYLMFAFAAAWQLLPLWLTMRLGEHQVQADRVS